MKKSRWPGRAAGARKKGALGPVTRRRGDETPRAAALSWGPRRSAPSGLSGAPSLSLQIAEPDRR